MMRFINILLSKTDDIIQRAPSGVWAQTPIYLLYLLVGYILFLGLNIAVSMIGVVPGYDALAYVNAAMRINYGFMHAELDPFLWVDATGSIRWVGVPFTNTLDVVVTALLYNIIDYHIAIWIIHSAYILLFVVFCRKIFSPATTLMFLIWVVSNTYFLHQYTNLISEFKVGVFLALFIAFLFHDDVTKHLKSIFWIVIILIFLRIINILFILPLVVTYALIKWRMDRHLNSVIPVLKAVGMAFLVLSPLLLHEISYLVPYIYNNSKTDMAQNWQDMAGVQGKWELFMSYINGVFSYNRRFAKVAVILIGVGSILWMTSLRGKLRMPLGYLIGAVVVFAILMQAQANNIMVVYWLFVLLGLVAISLLSSVLKEKYLVVISFVMLPFAISMNYVNFSHAVAGIQENKQISELANSLVENIATIEKPILFQNYAGVGPLDSHGLEVAGNLIIRYTSINNISYNTKISDYLAALDATNVAFIANTNFMWPDYLGINHKTEELAKIVNSDFARLGYMKLDRLFYNANPSQYIDIYARPSLRVALKYSRYDDYWLDLETPIVIDSANDAWPLDGYQIEMDVMVPEVDYADNFALPLTAKLVDKDNAVVGVYSIKQSGESKIRFSLNGYRGGAYKLIFDKSFTPANDARNLVVLFRDSSLKYIRDDIKNVRGSELQQHEDGGVVQ